MKTYLFVFALLFIIKFNYKIIYKYQKNIIIKQLLSNIKKCSKYNLKYYIIKTINIVL